MKTGKKKFTDKFLASLKGENRIYEVFDTEIPGFGIRVSPKGKRTFFLLARYGSAKSASRRRIGHYSSEIPNCLSNARKKGAKWKAQLEEGVDPRAIEKQQQEQSQRKYENTFGPVAEEFIVRRLSQLKSGRIMESDFRRRFIPRWKDMPVTEITHGHVVDVIDEVVAEGHRAQAFNSLTELRMFFRWVKARPAYGLKHLPTTDFDTASIIGSVPTRDRVFTEIEWRAFWRATEKFDSPYRELYQVLALTGQRLREISECSWAEVDLDRAVISIPKERMKGKKEYKRPHEVPLPPRAIDILKSLPRFEAGKFCFSNTHGEKPATSYSYAKRRFDQLMLAELKLLAAEDARPVESVTLPPWVVHDIRRSVRTELSRLRIPQQVAERVLAHKPVGIIGKYDKYEYADEKREALKAWENRLRAITDPLPSNVVPMRAQGA